MKPVRASESLKKSITSSFVFIRYFDFRHVQIPVNQDDRVLIALIHGQFFPNELPEFPKVSHKKVHYSKIYWAKSMLFEFKISSD